MRLPLLFGLILCGLGALPASATTYAHWEGYCSQGGQLVVTSSVSSTTKVQQSYPSATLTVYITGSSPLTKATLYSDNSGTSLGNPLTCNTLTAYAGFWVASGTYDLTFSGTGIATPFTYGAVQLIDPNTIVTANQNVRTLATPFDNNGSAISGTHTYCQVVPSSGTITSVYTTADVSGSATIGIKTVAYSSYTGTAGYSGYTSIVASAPPSLSSAVDYTDSTLTGWTTGLTAGTVMCTQLSSPSTVTNVQVRLLYTAN